LIDNVLKSNNLWFRPCLETIEPQPGAVSVLEFEGQQERVQAPLFKSNENDL